MQDTIVAISTSQTKGAISIIRLSGKDAISITNKITNIDLTKKASHTINYALIKDDNEIIDEVLITVMKEPKTYTKEDVIEINCHGSIPTTKKILSLLLKKGARLANPGEFTKRAFLNGRISLTEAQAVMDLINVKTEEARKIAMNNLEGKTTQKIKQMRSKILDILSNIEVNIDYPEYQDIEEVTKEKIEALISELKKDFEKLIENSKISKIIQNGLNVAIVGRPNVGKSSILNFLSQEDKAIVTDVPGTTRDIIEKEINLDGILLNLIDTAGIRKTEDVVETIGVNKSLEAIKQADLVLLILNNNEKLTKEDEELLNLTKDKKRIIVINKIDLENKLSLNIENENIVSTTTTKEDGLDSLIKKIKSLFELEQINYKDFNYVSNIENEQKLQESYDILKEIEQNISLVSIDMLEIDLKNIFTLLGEIIGITYQEEIIDHLFANFCVGK